MLVADVDNPLRGHPYLHNAPALARPRGALSEASIEISGPYAAAELSDLDHFLTARWAMFSPGRPALHHARAFHEPWPLHRARVVRLHDELVPASGLPAPHEEPLAHYAPSVEVRIGWPSRVSP